MLDSLAIKNYRNLTDLRLKNLGRVNLITGKNNTGKSSILEAIAIFAYKGNLSVIYDFLLLRGEDYRNLQNSKNGAIDSEIKSLTSLFKNRIPGFNKEDAIMIGRLENGLFGEEISNLISLQFVKYFDDFQRDALGKAISRKRTLIENEDKSFLENYKIGFEIKSEENYQIYTLDEGRMNRFSHIEVKSGSNIQFIRTRNIDNDINSNLWDNITLTEKEKFVIDALKIIEPATERLTFIGEGSRERRAIIKLEESSLPIPLKSMGDGINRILTIILALVNSDNGFLLIDEFENGLHYSVQKKLWEVIFAMAEKLKVQVFVTTHSEDCILGFESVLNSKLTTLDGKLIRLDSINGSIKQVEFDANELKIATTQNIETR